MSVYLKIYSFDEDGKPGEIKVIKIKNGVITMSNAIGEAPEKENVSKEATIKHA